jgi:hypothetical protein
MQAGLFPLNPEAAFGGLHRLTNLSAFADAPITKSLQLSGKGFG